VRLEIFDIAGRRVYRTDLGSVAAGTRKVTWDGTDNSGRGVAAGSYVARLTAGPTTSSLRFVIVK